MSFGKRRFQQSGKVIGMSFFKGREAGEINGKKYPAKAATWQADCVYGFSFDEKNGFSEFAVARFDITEEQHNKLKFGSNVNCIFEIGVNEKGTYDKGVELVIV